MIGTVAEIPTPAPSLLQILFIPDVEPTKPVKRVYTCMEVPRPHEGQSRHPYVKCSKGGAGAAATGGATQEVGIGAQWPEFLDQLLLSQRLGKKVAIE